MTDKLNRRARGRPMLPRSERAIRVVHVRLTDADYKIFRKRGGARWLRAMLSQLELL